MTRLPARRARHHPPVDLERGRRSRPPRGGLLVPLLAALLLASAPAGAAAQQVRCLADAHGPVDEWAVALRYAPALWFAPDEPYFPTVPFFAAVDELDNGGQENLADYADLQEVAPLTLDKGNRRLALDTLALWYTHRSPLPDQDPIIPDELRVRHAAVFFRVDTLSDAERVEFWKTLRTDRQLLTRLDGGILAEERCLDHASLLVVQYYMWYVNDVGLEGHLGDIEFVFVFAPVDPGLAERFRVVVGAGHSKYVANNVLVLHGDRAHTELQTPSVLVELGGHASAPDVYPYGVFSPGLDANWHPDNLWGVRDAAGSSGRAYLGNYDSWMTFPRSARRFVCLRPPPKFGATPARLAAADSAARARGACTRLMLPGGRRVPGTDAPGAAGIPLLPAGPDTQAVAGVSEQYALLPAKTLATLYRALRHPASGGVRDTVVAALQALQQAADASGVGDRWRFDAFADSLRADGEYAVHLQWMRFWATGMKTIPEHAHYRQPSPRILKAHLYRPVFPGSNPVLVWRGGLRYFHRWVVGGGFIVPVLPVTRLHFPGYLEIDVDATQATDTRWTPHVAASYASNYLNLAAWYVTAGWQYRPTSYHSGYEGSRLTVGGGLEVVPFIFNKNVLHLYGRQQDVRLRLGALTSSKLDRARWTTELAFMTHY